MTDTCDLAVGTLAPDFNLPASNGSTIALDDYRTKSKVYLFLKCANTTECNVAAMLPSWVSFIMLYTLKIVRFY